MEFLQLLLALIVVLLLMFRPKSEIFAYLIMWLGWIFMMYLYVGHTSGSLLGTINL